jgi:hypothetical protein
MSVAPGTTVMSTAVVATSPPLVADDNGTVAIRATTARGTTTRANAWVPGCPLTRSRA